MTNRDQQCGGNGNRLNVTNSCDREVDFTIPIEKKQSVKNAKQMDQRLRMDGKPDVFKARVCVVCDRFIIGTEQIYCITGDQLKSHEAVLGVTSYTAYTGNMT